MSMKHEWMNVASNHFFGPALIIRMIIATKSHVRSLIELFVIGIYTCNLIHEALVRANLWR